MTSGSLTVASPRTNGRSPVLDGTRPTPTLPIGSPIDRTSPVPLYFQIAENLRAAIEGGVLRPGDRLETEKLLSERLNVSRPTVRQAVKRLVEEGLVAHQRGIGAVVVDRRIQRRLALSSLYEDLKAARRDPATTVLSIQEVSATAEVAKALEVPAGHPVLAVERLRQADGRPLAIMRNYLPAELLRSVDAASVLARHGLYETLRRQGVQIHSAEDVIGARKASAAEAQLLEAPRNSTVLTMSRIAVDVTGRVVEYGVHAYLAERYSFRVVLSVADLPPDHADHGVHRARNVVVRRVQQGPADDEAVHGRVLQCLAPAGEGRVLVGVHLTPEQQDRQGRRGQDLFHVVHDRQLEPGVGRSPAEPGSDGDRPDNRLSRQVVAHPPVHPVGDERLHQRHEAPFGELVHRVGARFHGRGGRGVARVDAEQHLPAVEARPGDRRRVVPGEAVIDFEGRPGQPAAVHRADDDLVVEHAEQQQLLEDVGRPQHAVDTGPGQDQGQPFE
jgi:GntR family transcriptional regulator